MKKLRNTLIVILSLLLLVVTIYLLVETPFSTEGLGTNVEQDWNLFESGVQLISSSVFHP